MSVSSIQNQLGCPSPYTWVNKNVGPSFKRVAFCIQATLCVETKNPGMDLLWGNAGREDGKQNIGDMKLETEQNISNLWCRNGEERGLV